MREKNRTWRGWVAALALAAGSSGLASAALLEQLTPTHLVGVEGVDFARFTASVADTFGSAWGDVTALLELVPVDATPGCEASDFAGFTPGHIALIARGSCFFSDKVNNAEAAGAVGALIFNNVFVPPLVNGTLVDETHIPSLLITRDAGNFLIAELRSGELVTVHMQIPEPSSLALLGLGLAGLAASRRRK